MASFFFANKREGENSEPKKYCLTLLLKFSRLFFARATAFKLDGKINGKFLPQIRPAEFSYPKSSATTNK